MRAGQEKIRLQKAKMQKKEAELDDTVLRIQELLKKPVHHYGNEVSGSNDDLLKLRRRFEKYENQYKRVKREYRSAEESLGNSKVMASSDMGGFIKKYKDYGEKFGIIYTKLHKNTPEGTLEIFAALHRHADLVDEGTVDSIEDNVANANIPVVMQPLDISRYGSKRAPRCSRVIEKVLDCGATLFSSCSFCCRPRTGDDDQKDEGVPLLSTDSKGSSS